MNQEELLSLLKRYKDGTCTGAEKAALEKWFSERSEAGEWRWASDEERLSVRQLMHDRITSRLFPQEKKSRVTLKRIAIAAAVLICCSIVARLYVNSPSDDPVERFYTEEAVEPGKQAALLTLADGSTLRLDQIGVGTLLHGNGLEIKKMEEGELLYKVTEGIRADRDGHIATNTISIPRGGQYRLTLPDGTKVWLNSATTLAYPTVFRGNERTVTLTGEAYFEVAKNDKQPFKVQANGTEIDVTGTHFNVTAYKDEPRVVTTLVEGRVTVSKNEVSVALTPGTQAVTARYSDHIATKSVDTDYALAWINGDFLFEDQDIQAIMKNIARWYNVDVTFNGKPSTKTFGGTYTRSKGLEELLKHLESLSDIRFELKERRIIVMM